MRRSCGLGKKDSSHAGNGQFPPGGQRFRFRRIAVIV